MPERRPFVMLVAIALISAISAAIAPTAAAVTQPPTTATVTATATATTPTVHHYPSPSMRHSFKPRPTFRKKIFPIRRRSGVSRPKRPKPITYHGGPVMTGETHLYLIWYGSWDGNSATEILTDFANSLGGSPYYAINASYMQMDFSTVSGDLTFAGEIADAYSHGTRLTDTDVRRIVGAALTKGSLPTDEHGIYTVITSADVVERSGFTKSYCGWHSHARLSKTDIKFAFVGDPTTQGLSQCSAQTVSPNGNPGADAMVSIFAHEIVETVSDPDANAWYDRDGSENADKCSWTYGPDVYTVNGAKANILLGSRNYLIQQNWNAGKKQGCSMSPLN